MQVALAWLLRRSPNILLIPGTSSVSHLRENLAAVKLELPADAAAALDGMGAALPLDAHGGAGAGAGST
jgi:aryl-alcohol dehydrogenase-like predicted oxidoreductase